MKYKKHNNKSRLVLRDSNGFTIIEMVVALGVFTVVMMVAIGAILNIMNVQKRSLAVRALQENLNFVVDVMTREIIEGDNYGDGLGGVFTFDNSSGLSVTYTFDNSGTGAQLARTLGVAGIDPEDILTDPKITIDTIDFVVSGELSNDNAQPIVVINIDAIINIDAKISTKMSIQSVASQRLPDFEDWVNGN